MKRIEVAAARQVVGQEVRDEGRVRLIARRCASSFRNRLGRGYRRPRAVETNGVVCGVRDGDIEALAQQRMPVRTADLRVMNSAGVGDIAAEADIGQIAALRKRRGEIRQRVGRRKILRAVKADKRVQREQGARVDQMSPAGRDVE